MNEGELIERLASILLSERKQEKLDARNTKLKQVLLLLAKGAVLTTVLVAPNTARVLRKIKWEKSSIEEWKFLNKSYLRNTIARLELQKIVEIEEKHGIGRVQLTEKGRKKLLQFGLEALRISKPNKWDRKWRLVLYDVYDSKKGVREKFRHYLKAAGFYPLQESVYLHAYHCEKEVEFLKYFLGISGEVRLVVADFIENDTEYRKYFGVN